MACTRFLTRTLTQVLLLGSTAANIFSPTLRAEPIHVRQSQGATRGFLLVRSESGEVLAHGELTQTAHFSRVTSRVVYRFRDGSLDEDTTTYTQTGTFRFVSDHHIQSGPFFPHPIDALVTANGQITIRSTGKDGKPNIETQHIDLPADVSNGLIGTLLLNIKPEIVPFKVAFVAPNGKGRLIHLEISPEGIETFSDIGLTHKAQVFRIHINLGGVAGVVAPVLGKQPADIFVWVLEGEAPALIREIGALYDNGPTVSIELSGASFPTKQ